MYVFSKIKKNCKLNMMDSSKISVLQKNTHTPIILFPFNQTINTSILNTILYIKRTIVSSVIGQRLNVVDVAI